MSGGNDSGPGGTDAENDSLPVGTVELTELDAGLRLERAALELVAEAQRALLSKRGLRGAIKCLLNELPAVFGGGRAELRLHDPEGELGELLRLRNLGAPGLALYKDSDSLYELYPDRPNAALLSIDDERMFSILTEESELPGAAMMPLFDGVRLYGSYHLAVGETSAAWSDGEVELFSMLGHLVSVSLRQAIDYEKAQELTFVDPVTEVGNLRAFRRDLQREIAWARRVGHPLSLLSIGLDDLEELCSNFGEVACRFLQRRVSQRLCSALRATDYMAHTAVPRFAVLLPGCSEQHAHEIAERLRRDIESFPVDDGRGAVLYVTLSIGLVSWEPELHPLKDSERLAERLKSEARAAMRRMQSAGGNAVAVAESLPSAI